MLCWNTAKSIYLCQSLRNWFDNCEKNFLQNSWMVFYMPSWLVTLELWIRYIRSVRSCIWMRVCLMIFFPEWSKNFRKTLFQKRKNQTIWVWCFCRSYEPYMLIGGSFFVNHFNAFRISWFFDCSLSISIDFKHSLNSNLSKGFTSDYMFIIWSFGSMKEYLSKVLQGFLSGVCASTSTSRSFTGMPPLSFSFHLVRG